jgi:hypothetical protein
MHTSGRLKNIKEYACKNTFLQAHLFECLWRISWLSGSCPLGGTIRSNSNEINESFLVLICWYVGIRSEGLFQGIAECLIFGVL